jgi:hypothetical protein
VAGSGRVLGVGAGAWSGYVSATERSVMRLRKRWQQQATGLKREVYALYLACRDPRMPWYAKALAAGVVAYALSPIDLIPDFIPVLGYLEDWPRRARSLDARRTDRAVVSDWRDHRSRILFTSPSACVRQHAH